MASTLEGTFQVQTLVPQSITLPSSCVGNANVTAGAGVAASKLQHLHSKVTAQKNGTNNVAQREVLHIVVGATGTLKSFKCRNTTAASGGDSTSVQLKKNGSNILSGAITLDAAASTTVQSGTFSSSSVVVGDVLEVDASLSGTNVGQGFACQLNLEEDY